MKWALFNWKAPKQVDTRNFVTKDFLNTTLTDYVLSSSFNSTLSNYLTTNTAQTITGAKTFSSAPVSITTSNAALKFKPNTNTASYMEFYNGTQRIGYFGKTSSTNNDIELNSSSYLYLRSSNIQVRANTLAVSENSDIWLGRNIYAGYNDVKFIPRTTTIKNLQFYDTSPGDNRHFNLLVPEPTAANNPATKGYVDTNKADLQTQITSMNTNLGNRINQTNTDLNNLIQKRDYQWTSLSSTPHAYGEQFVYSLQITTLQETTVVGVNVSFQDQANSQTKSIYWNVSWNTTWGPRIYIKLFIDKYIYNSFSNKNDINLDWSKVLIRVFYIPKYNSRESEKIYEGEVVKLPEIKGGK